MTATSHPARSLPRPDLLSDTALALAVFAVSLGLLSAGVHESDDGAVDALSVALTALATLPLVARRAAPAGVFVSTALASIALRAVAEPAGPPLGPTVALFFLAADSDQSHARARIALAAALLIAHATATALNDGGSAVTPIAFGVVVWGGAWLAGDRARLRREQMAELERRALRAEQEAQRERRLAAAEERTRIARDLHDSAGHAVNVILVHAGLGRMRSTHDPAVRSAFETIEDVARQTVTDIDQLVGALRDAPSERGIQPPPGLAALDMLVERHRAAGLDVTVATHGDWRALPPGVDRGAYRILQEALTNVARHGSGDAAIEIACGPTVLEITVDNSVAPDSPACVPGGGHGLVGMRERTALLGGVLETGTHDGRFRGHTRLPLTAGSG